jgi:predicted peptidase
MRDKTIYSIISFFLISTVLFSQDNSLFKKKQFVQNLDTLNYRVLFPENFTPEKQYPIVFFLHGSGERGNDNILQLTHGSKLFTNTKNRKKIPAVVVFPQCPKTDYWSSVEVDRSSFPIHLNFKYNNPPTKSLNLVMALVNKLIAEPFTNKGQVYVLGLSMGGMGTFELIHRMPNTFAAAVPICGGGDPNSVNNYAQKIPLWVFHGAKDMVVNPQQSVEMVSAILEAGGFPKFTLYDKTNHNSWDSAFAEKDLLPWLFSQKIKKIKKIKRK